MKVYAVALIALLSAVVGSAERRVPLASGTYDFRFRDAEFSNWTGFPVRVTIRGDHVTVVNTEPRGDIPVGIILEATLMWNHRVGKWVLGEKESDRDAEEAGGCGDGPLAIDFEARDIWSCMWGPAGTDESIR